MSRFIRVGIVIFVFFLFSLFISPKGIEAFSGENHADIIRSALSFLKQDVMDDIIDENLSLREVNIEGVDTIYQFSSGWHFDDCAFREGVEIINNQYKKTLSEIQDEDFFGATDEFGQLLHPVQDFYSHSNWLELGFTNPASDLFDADLSYWSNLVPLDENHTVRNVVIIEGENRDIPAGYTLTLDKATKIVHVQTPHRGELLGLVSGSVYLTDNCPDDATLEHWDDWDDYTIVAGTGLNKDNESQQGFTEAKQLAIAQTTHEWCRLVNLVSQQGGDEAVRDLFKAWVDPAHYSEAIAACSGLNIDVISRVQELLDLEIIQASDSSNQLDLIFVIDTTGSMEDDIAEVKVNARAIVDEIATSGTDWQIGLVLYRDFGPPYGLENDEYVARTELLFSSNQDTILSAINEITIRVGAGDAPEAVLSGLMEAIEFPWRNGATKIIVLMGDAPPHPGTEPISGYTMETILQAAFDVDPANIFPVVIDNGYDTRLAFQELSDGSSGRLFSTASADDVVETLLGVIETATGEGSLNVGDLARVPPNDSEERLNLRAEPGLGNEIYERFTIGTVVTIIGGPEFIYPHIWWQVRGPTGIEGWSVEADQGDITLITLTSEETEQIPTNQCLVIAYDIVNKRSGPGTGNKIVGKVEAHETAVVNGQSRTEAFVWWRLETNGWVRDDVIGLIGNCENVPRA